MRVEDYRFVRVTIDDDGIALVVMGDPVGPDFIELQHPMHRELCTIWGDLAVDRRIRAAVITGIDDKFFQGPTLEALRDLVLDKPEVVLRQMAEVRMITDGLLGFTKPVVAAVNGTAISIGCQLALLSDEAIAAPGINFQDTHVRLGLTAGDGGTWMWPLLMGYTNARRFLLRSHPITAERALESGLIAEIVEPDQLVARAREIAVKLSSLPPFAYQSTRRALAQWMRLSALVSGDLSSSMQTSSYLISEFRDELLRRIDQQN